VAAADNANPTELRSGSVLWRYGLAVVSIAAALGLAHTFLYFHLPQPFAVFALSAIAITFWYGGTKPGILAVLLALIIRSSYEPVGRLNAVPIALYDCAIVIFALLMSTLTRARDELEVRVAERTTDLTRANDDLKLEIADRKQAEYLIGQVFECSPDGISIIDTEYRYRRVNPVYEKNWGIPAENIVGMHVADLVGHELFEQKLKPNLDRCFAGQDFRYSDWFDDILGRRRYLSLSYSPLRPRSHGVEAALVIIHDLTNHMLDSEKLRQAQSDLAHISRVTTMGELTASLAHEINQPIAAAITNAKTCLRWLTRDRPDVVEAREAALRSVNDANRAADIISHIRLLFTKRNPQQGAVDINEVIREMVVLLRNEANRYSIFVRMECASDLPRIMGDKVQLQQVFMNLMLNAMDAMKTVNTRRELTIRSEPGEDRHVLISVSDTGTGLSPQQIDQIFNAFFTTKAHGTGMGLSISRSIVESHGGRIWAENNSPQGARFCFTLPAKDDTPA
jgi:PAS domain S-box-containing protein